MPQHYYLTLPPPRCSDLALSEMMSCLVVRHHITLGLLPKISFKLTQSLDVALGNVFNFDSKL